MRNRRNLTQAFSKNPVLVLTDFWRRRPHKQSSHFRSHSGLVEGLKMTIASLSYQDLEGYMAIKKFMIGKTYTSEHIKKKLGPGSYGQVVVLARERGIVCVRFRSDLNPKWKTKRELWIHQGERRIRDAQRWIESKTSVPIFCGEDRTNNWTYLGEASASLVVVDKAAVDYTCHKNVALVLQMNYSSQ